MAAVDPDDGGHQAVGGPLAVSAPEKGTATAHQGGSPCAQPRAIPAAERVGGPHLSDLTQRQRLEAFRAWQARARQPKRPAP